MTELSCVLCEDKITSKEFNLGKSYTIYSNTLLLSFIHNFIDEEFVTITELSICKKCYGLLNELDNIEIRAESIRAQFREYISKSSRNQCKLEVVENLVVTSLDLEQEENKSDSSTKKIKSDAKRPVKKQLDTCSVCLKKIPSNKLKNHIKTQHPDLNNDDEDEEYLFNYTSIKTELNENSENDNYDKTDDDDDNNKVQRKRARPKKVVTTLKPYNCSMCTKTFKTPAEVKSHLLSHNNERPFICEICGRAYKREAALAIHVGMHNGINPFTCIYCNKAFTQKGALIRHMPIHTGELPYQCDLCGRRFVHHTSFNMHRISHTGQKSYKCEICGLALMSCSHLKRHMRVHTGEKKFSCNVCGKRFAEKYNLVAHQKLHSNDNGSGVNAKRKYRCQICDSTFERKMKLEEHLINDHQKIKMETESLQQDLSGAYSIL